MSVTDRGCSKGTGPEVDMTLRCSSSRRKARVTGEIRWEGPMESRWNAALGLERGRSSGLEKSVVKVGLTVHTNE